MTDDLTTNNGTQEKPVAGSWVLDLWVVIGITLLMLIFIYIPVLNDTIIRAALAVPMILFIPGYALIAALFPGKKDIQGLERVVLSMGLSISVVPLIGFGLNFTPWGIRLDPIVICTTIFTFACTLIAYARRRRLPVENRFRTDFVAAFSGLKEELFSGNSPLDKVLNVALVLSVIACIGVVAYIVAFPKQGESFTEFYILGPEGKAANYSTKYVLGDQKPTLVNVVNHEHRDVTYDLLITLDDNVSSSRLHSERLIIGHNQTWTKLVNLKPDRLGTDMKLNFLLYADGNMTGPYRKCRLWINVTNQSEAITNASIRVNTTVPMNGNETSKAKEYSNSSVINNFTLSTSINASIGNNTTRP